MKVKLKDGKVVDAIARNGRVFQILPNGQRPLHKGTFTVIGEPVTPIILDEIPVTPDGVVIEEGDDGSFDPSRIVDPAFGGSITTAEQAAAAGLEVSGSAAEIPYTDLGPLPFEAFEGDDDQEPVDISNPDAIFSAGLEPVDTLPDESEDLDPDSTEEEE